MTSTAVRLSPEPVVVLENAFQRPFDNAVATARTCYSSRVVHAEEVAATEEARTRRDGIAQSIYKAGHHTTIQHATFQFVLDKVSRHMIWSFLHSHPFYNSEQVSQRYVEMKPENFTVPALQEQNVPLYTQTVQDLMNAYRELAALLEPTVVAEYRRVYPARNPDEKRWRGAIKKRCQEVARYVLPLATHAHLYHTISGLTLHRYHRLCRQMDVPAEQQWVVDKMVEAVNRHDPDFFKFIEDPMPLEETLEYRLLADMRLADAPRATDEFVKEFDASLDGLSSKLIDYKANSEAVLAQSVRSVLGLSASALSDAEAVDRVMNPAKNPYFAEALNLTSLSKLTRCMVHPHFTFRKKISHAADSQNQRHRMTPASRPVLSRQVRWSTPDYVAPALVQASAQAAEFFARTMERLWSAMNRLREAGELDENVAYLLPNAFPIRFEESGDLLNFHHKWIHRLCYTAQEEIWKTSQQEVLQLQKRFPLLGRYFGAPCWMRKTAGVRPFCPEGDRYCGVTVWTLPVSAYRRLI